MLNDRTSHFTSPSLGFLIHKKEKGGWRAELGDPYGHFQSFFYYFEWTNSHWHTMFKHVLHEVNLIIRGKIIIHFTNEVLKFHNGRGRTQIQTGHIPKYALLPCCCIAEHYTTPPCSLNSRRCDLGGKHTNKWLQSKLLCRKWRIQKTWRILCLLRKWKKNSLQRSAIQWIEPCESGHASSNLDHTAHLPSVHGQAVLWASICSSAKWKDLHGPINSSIQCFFESQGWKACYWLWPWVWDQRIKKINGMLTTGDDFVSRYGIWSGPRIMEVI